MVRILTIVVTLISMSFPFLAVAADASHIAHVLLLTGGIGLQIASAQFEKQAQESYDSYLHTARPSEMQKLTDDYDQKHLQSTIFSKAGVGMMGLAAAWALMEQFRFTRNVDVAVHPREVRVAFHLLKR